MIRTKFLQSAASVGIAAMLVACDGAPAAQQRTLERFIERNQVGSSNDYWLELYNLVGEWERVALVTGYYDDFSGCSDIARLLMEEFDRQYRCMPAN